ncbi:hypothetical protein A2125_01115 [Candidatus Woesebacteria bacterium GWB1_43_5]|uniref:Uncharacterized protein n=1 Tax=Candidatus Woesebacteria bacterium GWB1_43_5 TaxID=1802474 RepID=A0A1F7WSQ4_9BACT|nr:MAG: hypothetical protein A2125_01115 [Candidatus Woesebacteria bacterium GWB1_43_5]
MDILQSIKSAVGNIDVSPGVIQTGGIVILVFLLLLVMARITRTYLSWYTTGWYVWVILGFLLAVVVEGFLVISGSTIFTSVLGWKNAPKPVQTMVDIGRTKLIDVLGAKETIPTKDSVVLDFKTLDSSSLEEVKSEICPIEE